MVPTSGTNKTFGHAARHARDQTAGEAEVRSESGRRLVAITIAFSTNQKISKEAASPNKGIWEPLPRNKWAGARGKYPLNGVPYAKRPAGTKDQ
jgi:hypothetical protein